MHQFPLSFGRSSAMRKLTFRSLALVRAKFETILKMFRLLLNPVEEGEKALYKLVVDILPTVLKRFFVFSVYQFLPCSCV